MLQFQYCDQSPGPWAAAQFGAAPLGDRRRVARTVALAAAMAGAPGQAIPALFRHRYPIKAAYTLLDRPEATPGALQAAHRRATLDAMRQPGAVVVLPEDFSTISYSGRAPLSGLGPIGNYSEGLQGFLLHTALAVRWPSAPPEEDRRPPAPILGVAGQIYHVARADSAGPRKRRAKGDGPRQSDRWMELGEQLGRAPAGVRWVRACDREADIFEFMSHCLQLGHGFVVRANQDRRALDAAGEPVGHVFEQARSAAPMGVMTIELRARPGQAARSATLSLSAATLRLKAPWRPGQERAAPLEVRAVRAWEAAAPGGAAALEWILLTDAAAADLAATREVVLQYSARWLIEEFHKALKTGLGAERLQLEKAERLFAAIAIMSVVALRLLDLRERTRAQPQAPAQQSGLSAVELDVLRRSLKRPVLTLGEVALAIGRLGGHMNRRADGPPGWKTLWIGYRKLRNMVEGFLLANGRDQFG